MKNMIKHLAGILMLCCMLTQFTQAQDASKMKASTPEQRAQLQTAMMKSKLKLDTLQVTKVQAINLKYAKKLDPILKSDAGKFKMFREARSIQKDKDADLKTVLTDIQFKQYEDMKDEIKDKVMESMKGKN